ncbi:peptide deformylase [Candidatus Bipolaricaulota bacterium]|nr:peptide deformylase [Candidatus Bipolaricaulota bacterium]
MGIVTYPDEALRGRSSPVENIDKEVVSLADGMTEALFRAEGIGLAAPQVGVLKRLIVVNVEDDFHIVVNPEIVQTNEEKESAAEGCLSIPGPEADVERPTRVEVRGYDLDGNEVKLTREGLAARVFLHEVDHLNGTLFIDHLSETARSATLKEYRNARKEENTGAAA